MVLEAPTAARSLLRPLERKDIPALAQLTRANREFLAPSSPLRPEEHFTDEGQERAALASLQAAENGTALPMVIVDGAGNLVGTLNINSIIRGAFQSASIGYWISQDRNGKGFASAAVAAAKRTASDQLGLHRLQAETLVDNEPSQRVLIKNGFVQYGRAPEYLKIAGRWQDHLLFQVTFPDAEQQS
ncbi:GNAT family N-acetyltransferase [Plantactinospora sp. WMMB782]|uniref:GNAT family N-acetyltransferase n=1 Tax=Plantactinospora sp. WMMB782 TaxID=3404121 RepID=UPI003B928D7B